MENNKIPRTSNTVENFLQTNRTRTNKKEIQNQKRNTYLYALQNEKLDKITHKKITTPTNFTNPNLLNLILYNSLKIRAILIYDAFYGK